MILAIAGAIGSGKTRLAASLVKRLGWGGVGFGDYVRHTAKSQGLTEEREALQELGEALVARGPAEFCRAVLEFANWRSGDAQVIDGIRHIKIYEALRVVCAPVPVLLVFVSVPDEVRLGRLRQRDGLNRDGVRAYGLHSTEMQLSHLHVVADLVVDGTLPDEQLADQVVNWLDQVSRPW